MLLVEENALARAYLSGLLNRGRYDVRIARTDGTVPGSEAQRAIVVIDIETLRCSPTSFVLTFTRSVPPWKALILADTAPRELLCGLMCAGVRGVLLYRNINMLAAAVRSILREGRWISAELVQDAAELVATMAKSGDPFEAQLTRREHMVVGLVERNLSNKEISASLGITERTVRFHLQNLFAKLNVHDRHGAVQRMRLSVSESQPPWHTVALAPGRTPPEAVLKRL